MEHPVSPADLRPEEAARLEYLRFQYRLAADGMEPDPSAEDLDYLNELDAEHLAATGTHIAPMDDAELTAWYAGRRAEVSALLGY